MTISYEAQAEMYYKGHKKYNKALAAGKAMDNALKMSYTKGGTTNTHFMMDNYLKYFEYSKLPK